MKTRNGPSPTFAGTRPSNTPGLLGSDLLLWQITDSAFPTGGFAHSGGLEAALQLGEVPGVAGLEGFIHASLSQAAHSALIFVRAAHRQPRQLAELDRSCDAFLSNHVANRASRAQGQAFLLAAQRSFSAPALAELRDASHFAPIFGATTHTLGIDETASGRSFIFILLRGLISAAVRLGIVGPMEAQSLQHRLASRAETIASGAALSLEEIAQSAPLLDVWQAGQDRLYSRLFQS